MQNSQWKVIGDQLPMKIPAGLKENSILHGKKKPTVCRVAGVLNKIWRCLMKWMWTLHLICTWDVFFFCWQFYDVFCSELAMHDDYPVLVAELDVEELTGKST